MSSNVIFNGCEIRYLDLRRDEGGVFSRIHIAFSPSEPVMQALGWDPFPDSIPRGPLTGRLAGTHMILTPTDKALKKHEIQFSVNEVRDFSFTSETNDQGHIIGRTIRATVVVGDAVEAIIGNWLRVVGEASAVAKIGYTVQQQLPGTEVVDDKQTVMELREPEESEDKAEPVSTNDLNAMGSGREKRRRTRGAVVHIDHAAPDAAERDAVERQIAESLQ